jgi:hypothetical protein
VTSDETGADFSFDFRAVTENLSLLTTFDRFAGTLMMRENLPLEHETILGKPLRGGDDVTLHVVA